MRPPGRPDGPVESPARAPVVAPTEWEMLAGRDLSERELDALRMIARGYTDSEIAAALWLSKNTVKTHVRRLLAKLGARSRAHAVAVAYERGLLPGVGRGPVAR